MTHRLGAVALLLIAVAVAALTFGGARPASAEGTTSPGRYLVMDVPGGVVDDLVAVERDAARSGGWFSGLSSEFATSLCETFPGLFDCICVGVSPDLCEDA